MQTYRLFLLFGLLAGWAAHAPAADLTKIDRTIAKEPAYQGKPKYCLLVFGPEAKFRVWVVRDDNVTYVDRSGNGDLTEARNKIERTKGFVVKEITDPNDRTTYKNLSIVERGSGFSVSVECGDRSFQSFSLEGGKRPQFADRPADAPILAINGPLTVGVFEFYQRQDIAGYSIYLTVHIGTQGQGDGTFLSLNRKAIPAKTFPTAQIEVPDPDPTKPALVSRVILDETDGDGCPYCFSKQVRPAKIAEQGKVKVTLSFADWKEGNVVPTTREFPIALPKRKQ